MKILSFSRKDTIRIGRLIARNLKAGDIICLFGEFGSGKTVLTKGIAQGIGIKNDGIISPSFVLLRQHMQGRLPLYHFDLYRLKTALDIAVLGYEDYFYGDGLAVIEWADKLGRLMPEEFLKVELLFKTETKRLLKISGIGKRYEMFLKAVYRT
ncbi:MAG: tRNA (adenosine(37)-N6)-threonylcarbamoyltransferase complex ATPase subunit type 1 TsaE [Candidatus Omnitrophota bacterium]|nr:tRNA (adenosine(37)-N6)-threonylcarbamoyltransferase complex ATPase subunit type 1 TsaE [Candidatus Omnitrophota bacterium]